MPLLDQILVKKLPCIANAAMLKREKNESKNAHSSLWL